MANNTYLVEIHYEAPYPATKQYTTEASNFGLAVNRAFARFRKEKVTTKRQSLVKFWTHKLPSTSKIWEDELNDNFIGGNS